MRFEHFLYITGLAVAAAAAAAVAMLILRRWRRGKAQPTPFPSVPVRQIQIGEWKIRYHMSGRGPHIVLLHGIGANLFCWRGVIPLLAPHFTVVALDLPGFGQSSKPRNAHYGLDDQVERLRQFFRHLGIQPKVIVGNSMGGNIALWYSLLHPSPDLRTVVIAPAASPSLVPLAAAKLHWLSRPLTRLVTKQGIRWAHRRTVSKKELVDPDRVNETYLTYKNDKGAVRSFMLATESIRDPRLGQRLSELQTPLLVLWGTHDRLVPQSVVDRLKAALPKAEMHIHQGGGHHLQEDEPRWVCDKIDAFTASKLD